MKDTLDPSRPQDYLLLLHDEARSLFLATAGILVALLLADRLVGIPRFSMDAALTTYIGWFVLFFSISRGYLRKTQSQAQKIPPKAILAERARESVLFRGVYKHSLIFLASGEEAKAKGAGTFMQIAVWSVCLAAIATLAPDFTR